MLLAHTFHTPVLSVAEAAQELDSRPVAQLQRLNRAHQNQPTASDMPGLLLTI